MSDFDGYAIAELGTNKTGKTTLGLEFIGELIRREIAKAAIIVIKDLDEPLLQRFRVIDHSEIAGVKSGVVCLVASGDFDHTFEALYEKIPPNTVLYLDDAGTMLSSKERKGEELLGRRRQKQIHFIANFHGALGCPARFYANLEELWIFTLTDSVRHLQNRMLYPKTFENTVLYINYLQRFYGKTGLFFRYRLADPPDNEELRRALQNGHLLETSDLFLPSKK